MEKFFELARAAKVWALFAAIAYVVGILLMIIGYEEPKDIFSIVIYVVFAILLFQYYQAVAKSAKEEDIEQFELACERQGRFVQVAGVLAMIAFVIIAIAFVIGIIAAVSEFA